VNRWIDYAYNLTSADYGVVMEPEIKHMKDRLGRIAERAAPLHVEQTNIEQGVRRRRRGARAAVITTSAAALIVVAAVGVVLSQPDKTVDGPSRASNAGQHPIACGTPLAPPTMYTSRHGIRLSISGISRLPGKGVASVSVSLAADSRIDPIVNGITPLQILLTKDGVVVDRIATYRMSPDGVVGDWIDEYSPKSGHTRPLAALAVVVGPAATHFETVTGPGHCKGADWNAAWAGAPGYALVAAMSEPWLMEDLPRPSPLSGDPLLVSSPVPVVAR
jgi:hypothetical protein